MTVINFPAAHAVPEQIELRSSVVAEIIRQVLSRPAPIPQHELFSGVLRSLEKQEEEIGHEIVVALFLLTQGPILDTNTFGVQGHNTTFAAAEKFKDYVFKAGMGFETYEEGLE